MPPMKTRDVWRSLDELAGTEEFQQWLRHEFPAGAEVWLDGVSRRGFLKYAGASIALAGFASCAQQPLEAIVPSINKPESRTEGEPRWFATTLPFRGFGIGVLAKSFEGRPVKIEGNPDHPASLGATDAFAQAAIYELYDPDRAKVVRREGTIATWDDFTAEAIPAMQRQKERGGAGLRILTEGTTSPTLSAQIGALLATMPGAKWIQYDSVGRDTVYAGTRLAFGTPLEPRYHFDRAAVVVALDSDFMTTDPGAIRYAHDFIAGRRIENAKNAAMNRMYAVEPMPTVTGSMADHRLPLRASGVQEIARALAARVGVPGVAAPAISVGDEWIEMAARDLVAHRGAALVIAGDAQPPEVHALAHAMTSFLGGNTITYGPPLTSPEPQDAALRELAGEIDAGAVELLLIVGGNPVYTAPADVPLRQKLKRLNSIYLSPYRDETAAAVRWHLPRSHALEAWSDLRAYDGTASVVQPLIAPLFDTRSAHEVLALLSGVAMPGHDVVKGFWRTQVMAANFDAWWQATLARGIVEGSSVADRTVTARTPPLGALPQQSGVEINFRPDPTIWDGRYANNGWLQELPKPITKMVWSNAAMISPRMAASLHTATEKTIEIELGGRKIDAPVWIVPGHADDAVTLHHGYGRRLPAQLGDGHGFDAGVLRTGAAFASGGTVRATPRVWNLTSTQHHFTLEGRDMFRAATLEEFRREPDFVRDPEKEPRPGETMYPAWPYDRYAWGMAIDLNACIGCNACVIACVAENNIPVVGPEQVERGREMHWLRIDGYFEGGAHDPKIYHQPVPCMHCEDAPCEIVCPVGATVHSSEGLNEMIYNRCIGTRYCSNNCPYKVRRFNFLEYSPHVAETVDLMHNPDVTVRTRGVMEKCSYCVQRIEHARIKANDADRPIRDGEIVTACQQACPTQAIVFGNTNDGTSRVAKLKAQSRNYAMLAELNTRPRTTYLGKLTNPHE